MRDGLLKQAGETLPVPVTANTTVRKRWIAPCSGKLTSLKLLAPGTAPSSSAGTYLFTAAIVSTNLLAAANFDLETLVADTVSSPALSATAANLDFDKGDVLKFDFVSNNGDLTGLTEMALHVGYDRR